MYSYYSDQTSSKGGNIMRSFRSKAALLLRVFWTFCRIGPSTFGGGYAMIPVIEKEVVTKQGWIAESDMGNIVSIAGSAPGGVGVNAAAFIGYRVAGIPGATAAVVGITLPTFLIVFLLSLFYSIFEHNEKIAAALKGIQGAIIALIMIAAYKMAKTSLFDLSTKLVAAAALGALIFTPIHPLFIILGGIGAGMILIGAKEKLGMNANTEKRVQQQATKELIYPEYYI